MLQYDRNYKLDEDDNGENHKLAQESDPTLEAGDEYLGAQVTLPHGDQVEMHILFVTPGFTELFFRMEK